jgi:hypothetical protein
VRVQLHGAAVSGAHVIVTAADGKPTGTGDTNASGVWKLNLADGDYTFAATGATHSERASVKQHVEASTRLVIVDLDLQP